MSVNTFVASLASFFPNPEIPGEKRAKSGWVGVGWGWVSGKLGYWLSCSPCFSAKSVQAHSQGLWVLCAEIGVPWHILGAGEV